ncbi:unnamed protein product [Linum tenue]|uniref:Uncharacterized protein n=1 Tax=Linum tenue TaxID=586396 RepID=A0AAV0L7M7_9ROSI|nr:unnamed protein product [Linum tenue]
MYTPTYHHQRMVICGLVQRTRSAADLLKKRITNDFVLKPYPDGGGGDDGPAGGKGQSWWNRQCSGGKTEKLGGCRGGAKDQKSQEKPMRGAS